MFAVPMPLTIGDSSTVYNTYRKFYFSNSSALGKERSEVGRIKSVIVNPCKSANEGFGPLNSNCINNPYVEPGKYHLRGESPSVISGSPVHLSPFKNMHGNKTIQKSEFNYDTNSEVKGSHALKPFV